MYFSMNEKRIAIPKDLYEPEEIDKVCELLQGLKTSNVITIEGDIGSTICNLHVLGNRIMEEWDEGNYID